MTAHGLICRALGLQASYHALKGKRKAVEASDLDRKTLISTGLAQSASIILPFAVEIALKSILTLRRGTFPKSHDLRRLYEELDEGDRASIAERYKVRTGASLDECLERHKDMFVAFRYLDQDMGRPNLDQLDMAINSVVDFYNEHVAVEE